MWLKGWIGRWPWWKCPCQFRGFCLSGGWLVAAQFGLAPRRHLPLPGMEGGEGVPVPHVVRGRHASHKLQLPTSKGAGAGAAELCRWSLPVLRSFPFTLPRAAGEGAATSTLKLAPAPPANHFCRCLILPLFRLWHHHAHSSIVHPRFPLSSTTVGLQQA